VKEDDIVRRLKMMAVKEGLEVEEEALVLIASTADGSLRDAEMTMDQLSLLDRRISLVTVQELVSSQVPTFPIQTFSLKKIFKCAHSEHMRSSA
jgi:DNA polymerase III gamma/tau subunit